MSDMDWIERMEEIRSLCEIIAEALQENDRMGRMPAIDEARSLDRLSQELLERVRQLPADVCSRIGDPRCRTRMQETVFAARELLGAVVGVQGNSPRTSPRIPRAASGRVKAYQVC